MVKRNQTRALVIMSLMTAILIIFSFTLIGTIPIGPLSITLNIIPVAIAAIALGPKGGLAMGSVFGILSFLQCIGIGIPSGLGAALFSINPFFIFVQRFVPRALDGLLVGYLFRFCTKKMAPESAVFIAGFASAFLNTLLFMSALVLLFGNTAAVQDFLKVSDKRNILIAAFASVAINAVVEIIASTIVTGVVGAALYKAKTLPLSEQR